MDLYNNLLAKIIPSLTSPQYKYLNLLSNFLSSQKLPAIKWLDLGCGHMLIPKWIPDEKFHKYRNFTSNSKLFLFGIDVQLSSLNGNTDIKNKIIGDIIHLPFKSNSFDLISANMVVEHLDNPDFLFKEIHRILSSDGNFIFITPWKYYYLTLISSITPKPLKNKLIYYLVGREEKDVFSTYYRLNTVPKIRKLANQYSFNIKRIVRIEDDFCSLKKVPVLNILEIFFKKVMSFDCCMSIRSTLICCLKKSKLNNVKF